MISSADRDNRVAARLRAILANPAKRAAYLSAERAALFIEELLQMWFITDGWSEDDEESE